jgi:hypothetical protein
MRIVGVGDTDLRMIVGHGVPDPRGGGVGDTDLRMRGGVARAVETASPASEGSDAKSADGAE